MVLCYPKGAIGGLRRPIACHPKTEEEVITIAAAIARHRIPLTIRGGGTGNYGQCIPIEGGVVLETTKLNKVPEISKAEWSVRQGRGSSRWRGL